ncbi:MAG: glucosamine-6-phosphate deaminase [Ignavibacteriaceae bacterium]
MGNIISKTFSVEKLKVVVAHDRQRLSELSVNRVSKLIRELLNQKEEVRMVFAAAPSQNEFLFELTSNKDIDWNRITAFHMDEYIGLPEGAPQLFSKYLTEHLFSKLKFKKVNLINSQAKNILQECGRYELLLKENPLDIICMGIGENGHIAFNDPPVANFNDPQFVKIVNLDLRCRLQQVNDGCFNKLEEVPQMAITLTVSALLSGSYLNIVVPGKRKAEAIRKTLYENISTGCPASIVRKHDNAILYLDSDSANQINYLNDNHKE